MIERNEDPSDRRARVLDLTPEGRSLAQRLTADIPLEREVVFDGVSKSDLETMSSVLDQINANVRPSLLA